MLLSLDWDAWSGPAELIFDAPIWGTPDREHDRWGRWQQRAQKRGGWAAMADDYPLYPGWERLIQYAGRPVHCGWSHAQAREWLALYPPQPILNIDSHHDLYSQSGDPARWRPGNWAGQALAAGWPHYTARYPGWHAHLPVAEGFDLARTAAELDTALPPAWQARIRLERSDALPPPADVNGVLLVQSPSWSSPAHDAALLDLLAALGAIPLAGGGVLDRRALLRPEPAG
jgi:hypothetical protein